MTVKNKSLVSGRDRIFVNTVTSWVGQLVFIIAGFVMPRMIDESLGTISLGIWDFCWSLVNYLQISNMGFGSSVNRYVAKYRSSSDVRLLRETISTVICIQFFTAVVIIVFLWLLINMLPGFFPDKIKTHLVESSYVITFLGGALVVQMFFDTSRGILTGYHRWDIHNAINSGMYLLNAVLMLTILLLGGGLYDISLAYFCVSFVAELVRHYMAKKISSEYKLSIEYFSISQAKKLFFFGGKTALINLPVMLVLQTTSILVASALGPVALAVFSRPLALMRHVETFVRKFSFILAPTVGSLKELNDNEAIKEIMLSGGQFAVSFSLFLILPMLVFGDVVLDVWMGPDYANLYLINALGVGYFFHITQFPAMQVLVGLNAHGRIALIKLFVTLAVYLVGLIYIWHTDWTLVKAGWVASISLALGGGLSVPIYACKKLNITLFSYVKNVFYVPVIISSIYFIILISGKMIFIQTPIIAFIVSGLLGASVTFLLYWFFLVPDTIKFKIKCYVKRA